MPSGTRSVYTFPHAALDIDGTAHRVHHAGEFHQYAVAGDAHEPSEVFLYLRIDKDAPMLLPLGERAFFVCSDQPAVASHIGRQNGRVVASRAQIGSVTCFPSNKSSLGCP